MPSRDEGLPASLAMGDLVRDIMDWQLCSYITASTALILYEWFLTNREELTFIWHRGGNPYVRILFLGARYTALACAIMSLFLMSTKKDYFMAWLSVISIICSEWIFVLRTWAIWERSRPILLFLIGLFIAGGASAIVMIQLSKFEAPVTSTVTWVIEGVGPYKIQLRSFKHVWVLPMPFLLLLVLQSVVLALTLYRVLRYHMSTRRQSKSTLVDVLWIHGIIYFIFMFLLNVLNVVLTLKVSRPLLQPGFAQFQTVLQSVLSTRIVLHTATVLRQEVVDSRPTFGQNRRSTTGSMRFAEITSELVPEEQN